MHPWLQLQVIESLEAIDSILLPFAHDSTQRILRSLPPALDAMPIDLDKLQADTETRPHGMEPAEEHALTLRKTAAAQRLNTLAPLMNHMNARDKHEAFEYKNHIEFIKNRQKQGHALTYRQSIDQVELMEKLIAELERHQKVSDTSKHQ